MGPLLILVSIVKPKRGRGSYIEKDWILSNSIWVSHREELGPTGSYRREELGPTGSHKYVSGHVQGWWF